MMKKSLSLLIGVSALLCANPTWAMQCRDLLTNELKINAQDFFFEGQVDDVLEFLLGSGVNARNKNGYTPLILASMYGRADVVELLLEYENIKVNAADNDGYTAFMWAFSKRYTNVVELLLGHEEIDVAEDGNTALMLTFPKGTLGGHFERRLEERFERQFGKRLERNVAEDTTALMLVSPKGP